MIAQLGAPAAIRELVAVGPVREQTEWMAEILADPAITALNVVADARGDAGRARRSSSSSGREPSSTVAARHGDREPGAARAVHARRRGDVRGAARARRRPTILERSRGPGRDRGARRRARLAVSLRRTRVGAPHAAARARSTSRCCTCPYLFVARPGPARHPDGRRRARPGARPDDARWRRRRPIEPRSRCSRRRRSWCSAARAASARRRPRPRRRVGGGHPARRQGARAHDRPGEAARRRARARGVRQRREARARRGARGGRARAARRAVGRDARHEASRGTTSCCATRPTRRPRTGSSRTGCTTTSPAGSCRATTTSRWSASSRSTRPASTTSSSSTRRRRGTRIDFLEAPTRMADFFGGRLLRWLTMPYRVGGKRGARVINVASRPFYQDGRPHPRQPVPPGHRRVLPELPVDVRRVRRAAPRRSSGCCTTGARRSRSSRRSRARRCTRPSSSATSSMARNFHLGALVAEQARCPTYFARARRRTRRPSVLCADSRSRSPRRCARSRCPALADGARQRRACCGRSASRSANFAVVATPRSRAQGRAAAAIPRRSSPCPASRTTSTTSPGWPGSGTPLRETDRHRYHRPVATLAELARTNTALRGDALAHVQRLVASWRAARRPLASPTSCSSRRSRARRGTGSSCWRRCGPRPARRCTRSTSSARRRRGRAPARHPRVAAGGDRRGRHHGDRRRRSGRGCSASPCGTRAR